MGWVKVNKLKLDPDIAENLWVSGKADQGQKISPVLDMVILPLKSQVCSLGELLETEVLLENGTATGT